MIKRFQVTDPPMFWLVSRVVRPSPSPWMPSPPRYLTSAISASWSSVSNSCGHHTSLVAAFPLEPLSISSDEALAPARRSTAHKTEGGGQTTTSWNRAMTSQEATPDNETGTCTRLYLSPPPFILLPPTFDSFLSSFSKGGMEEMGEICWDGEIY